MSSFDEYFATLTAAQRAEFERIRGIVREEIPTVEEGVSYGMPAYLYRGKAVLSAMARKGFLSLYPFSGKVIELLADSLRDFETTSGSIHYQEAQPIPDGLVRRIVACRVAEIDAKPHGKK